MFSFADISEILASKMIHSVQKLSPMDEGHQEFGRDPELAIRRFVPAFIREAHVNPVVMLIAFYYLVRLPQPCHSFIIRLFSIYCQTHGLRVKSLISFYEYDCFIPVGGSLKGSNPSKI
jgi:hypothetical protein